jgi:sirohydrochlorin ferrochelatase
MSDRVSRESMIGMNRKNRRVLVAIVALGLLASGRATFSQDASVSGGGASSNVGILLLAHGGSKEWNANVQSIAAEAGKSQPTEVALGMADRTTMQAGIDKLMARGVTEIVAVPLFVSSHSSVIESTRFLLGLRADAPAELADYAAMDMGPEHAGHGDAAGGAAGSMAADTAGQDKTKPVAHTVPIKMSAALDRHQILADILVDRAAAISHNPTKEELVLVAHGPNEEAENALWLADLTAVSKLVAAKAPYARVEVATLRDDAEPAVRDAATGNLRNIASAGYSANLRVLIVPVLLSYGGIENGIRKRLDGLDHVMSPAGLLPDPRIVTWILASAKN